jgi:hypothetical protein
LFENKQKQELTKLKQPFYSSVLPSRGKIVTFGSIGVPQGIFQAQKSFTLFSS